MKIDVFELKDQIRKAGDEVMKLYHQEIDIQKKQDSSPVTEADLLSNNLLVEILKKTNIPILSEEIKDSPERLNSDKLWIIDPLDGTKDFIQKTDEFSLMVALIEKGKPILGIVYAPALGKLYYAQKGEGAFLELRVESKENGVEKEDNFLVPLNKGDTGGFVKSRELRVSDKDNFEDWSILVSRNHLGKEEVALAEKLKFKAKVPTGSIGVKLGLIAEGKAEMYLHAIDKTWEWDIAAPQIILEEEGGKVTDIDGEKLVFNKKTPKNFRGILATNRRKHERIIKELNTVISAQAG